MFKQITPTEHYCRVGGNVRSASSTLSFLHSYQQHPQSPRCWLGPAPLAQLRPGCPSRSVLLPRFPIIWFPPEMKRKKNNPPSLLGYEYLADYGWGLVAKKQQNSTDKRWPSSSSPSNRCILPKKNSKLGKINLHLRSRSIEYLDSPNSSRFLHLLQNLFVIRQLYIVVCSIVHKFKQ